MSKRSEARKASLLPNGRPRWIRCYDNGGKTIDRYTVVYTGRYNSPRKPGVRPSFQYVGMNHQPFHPQGFGQHGESNDGPIDTPNGKWPPAIGRKCFLGKRIHFTDLPPDCQRLVMQDYCEIWKLGGMGKGKAGPKDLSENTVYPRPAPAL